MSYRRKWATNGTTTTMIIIMFFKLLSRLLFQQDLYRILLFNIMFKKLMSIFFNLDLYHLNENDEILHFISHWLFFRIYSIKLYNIVKIQSLMMGIYFSRMVNISGFFFFGHGILLARMYFSSVSHSEYGNVKLKFFICFSHCFLRIG